jgi:hypothetical protein
MIVERLNNEILIRLPASMDSKKLQSILDFLRYEELTTKSKISQKEVDDLINVAKKGRWNKIST